MILFIECIDIVLFVCHNIKTIIPFIYITQIRPRHPGDASVCNFASLVFRLGAISQFLHE